MSALPLPRLELRWLREDEPGWWVCRYALILPCDDGRDPGWGWVSIPLGETRRDAGHEREPISRDPPLVDTPFRDGVHIRRDAWVLKLPAYAVYGAYVTPLEPIVWEPSRTMGADGRGRPVNKNHYLAEFGYMTYARATQNKNYQGQAMPSWDALPEPQKTAWIHAAAAIRRRVVHHGMTAEEEPEAPAEGGAGGEGVKRE